MRMMRNRSRATMRAMRCATLVLGIGLMAFSGAARAEDDEDDLTFEEKIIKGIMTGLGGTNMENTGIEYRERSPLVIPPKVELPPPAAAAEAPLPNWPKDPEVKRRKELREARKKDNKDPREASRILTPSELAAGKTAAGKTPAGPDLPGNPGANAILSPSQLGWEGGLKGMFGGGSKTESAPFKGEPARDSLIMPPPGYQTPSPNYAYGTGPKESLVNKEYNPAKGKYGD